MNRVSDNNRSTLLSFLSCGALQNDEIIIGILKVLFQYLGIGTRLVMCSVNWMEAREFVILVEPVENKSRTGRGSLCETRISRKLATSSADEGCLQPRRSQWRETTGCHVLHMVCHHRGLCVVEPVDHQASLRGRLRSWKGASRQGKPENCLFSRHIRLASFCAFVQSRRRPEKWTRTGKSDSRGSVTADFVCVCTLYVFLNSRDVGGGRLHRAARARHRQAL